MSGFVEHDVTVHQGHVLDVLPMLPAESVNCVVTSPPYFGLRDYGVDGQIGLESSPVEYVERLRSVFAEVRRVLTGDGVVWLNLGDSYVTHDPGGWRQGEHLNPGGRQAAKGSGRNRAGTQAPGLRPKNLLGIPWRVAFALQDDDWTLRNAIIWNKPNAMPESVTDRLSCRYEHVFLFSKSRRYWFDLDPVREPLAYPDAADGSRTFGGVNKAGSLTTGSSARRTGNTYGVSRRDSFARETKETDVPGQSMRQHRADRPDVVAGSPLGRNPGDVWTIPTSPFPGAHFATMPPELARRCILAGCPPEGVVLDPFAGSGTTLKVARSLGRKSVGIELNPDYIDIIRDRIGQTPLDFGAVS